jgi:hypothetical protein
MRLGSAWRDVNILNISSRGLLLHAAPPPERGTYVEVRRGPHVIVARVVWSSQERFGVQSQDPLCIDSIISEPDRSSGGPGRALESAAVDRRAASRNRPGSSDRHERSRQVSRIAEYLCLATFGAFLAAVGFEAVAEALGRPISQMSGALAQK